MHAGIVTQPPLEETHAIYTGKLAIVVCQSKHCVYWHIVAHANLVLRACDPREGTRGSGINRCRKPGILAKIELRIPLQRPIRFLPGTDYPRASRSFPRIAGSGNEIALMPSCLCVSAKLNFIFAVGNLITLTDKRALRADKAKIYSQIYANI